MVNNRFEINTSWGTLLVQHAVVSGEAIYRIEFDNGKKPLVITRALHANANKFWTSVPEGRQSEAEAIGPLITEFMQKKK